MACLKREATNEWIAAQLTGKGYRVSASLASRWRLPQYAELPNYAHIVALGPDFERAYAKVVRDVNGWGRLALLDMVMALGDLAEEMSA
jgi:hypothetical protein